MTPTSPRIDLDEHRRVHARIAQSMATHTGRMPWASFGALDCVPVGALLLALALLPPTLGLLDQAPRLGTLEEAELHAGP